MLRLYGMPLRVGEYTKICAIDYPKDLPYLADKNAAKITGATKSGDVYTVPLYNGSWASK
jgi:hypothetical protein